MARSFGESFAKTFTPAWKESYQFTAAELAEEEKDRKQKNRLKRAGEAKFETILGMTPPEIVEEVSRQVPEKAVEKGRGVTAVDVLSPIDKIRQAVASQKGRMGKAAMQSAITSKLLSRASVAQGLKDWELGEDFREGRGKRKKHEADLKILNEWNETNRWRREPTVQDDFQPLPKLPSFPPLPRAPEDADVVFEDPRKLHSIPVRPQLPSNFNDYVDKKYIDEDGNYTMKWLKRMNGDRNNMMMFKDLTEYNGSFPKINSLGTAKMKGNFSNMLKQINQEMTNNDMTMLRKMQMRHLGVDPESVGTDEGPVPRQVSNQRKRETEEYIKATTVGDHNTPEENRRAKRLNASFTQWISGQELEKYAKERAAGEVDAKHKAEIKKLYSETALRSPHTSTKKHDGDPIWILIPSWSQTAEGYPVTVLIPRFHPERKPSTEEIKKANAKAKELFNEMNDLGNANVGSKGEIEFQNKGGVGANTVRYEKFPSTK